MKITIDKSWSILYDGDKEVSLVLPKLTRYLHTRTYRMSEEDRRRLLLYAAFVQVTCQKFHHSPCRSNELMGWLPRFFRNIPGYKIKDAVLSFNAATPWDRLREDPDLMKLLDVLLYTLETSGCATPEWLREQVEALYYFEGGSDGVCATPPQLRQLIAALAAHQPVERINDLCSGTSLLGLQIWDALGASPAVSYRGVEQDSYLYALSSLLLFLCGVEDSFVQGGDAADWRQPADAPRKSVYVADFPLVGSHTVPVHEGRSLYFDWAVIQTVLEQMKKGEQAFFVVTSGALVRKNEMELRQKLLKQGLIRAVITFPAGLYPSHSLPTALLVCEKGVERPREVLFAEVPGRTRSGSRQLLTREMTEKDIREVCRLFDGLPSRSIPSQTALPREGSLNPALYLTKEASSGRRVQLKEVASVTRGLQLRPDHPRGQGPCCLLNVRDILDDQIRYETAERIEYGADTWEQRYRIQEDDIILTTKGTALRMVIVPPHPPHAYISGNLTILRSNPRRYHPYLLYEYLRSEAGLAALSLIQTGTTIRVLGVAALEGLTVPDGDPALMEQRGGILKDLTLRHRAEAERLQQVYQEQKRKLLENIYEREETTI